MTMEKEWFARAGEASQIRGAEDLLAGLPSDPAELVKVVQGCVVHIFWAQRYGLNLTEERQAEVSLRTVERKLARLRELDPRPMTQARALEYKLVCNCRDFSLLMAALLRSQGIPARARCGFATYFVHNHYEDHWVVEAWSAEQARWVMMDAQMDALQREALKLPFNPLDMPPGVFITAGPAWQMCRKGQADSDAFGIFEYKGWDFVRGNLLRDLLSLVKMETLPWDVWGPMQMPFLESGPEAAALVDEAADICARGDTAAARCLVEDHPLLRPPADWW